MARDVDTLPSALSLEAGELPHWAWRPDVPGVRGAFTTRAGGVSEASYHRLNLGASTGDRWTSVEANRARVTAALGLDAAAVRTANQVHGTDVVDAAELPGWNDRDRASSAADAVLVRAGERQAAAVVVADCVPVLLAGPGGVAAVHAGWRGAAEGVVERAVDVLGGCSHAAIGPSARGCCYEVPDGVAERCSSRHALPHPTPGMALLDLAAVVRERLEASGVERIDVVDACTLCDERYFSFRRDGGVTGRQCGIVWLV